MKVNVVGYVCIVFAIYGSLNLCKVLYYKYNDYHTMKCKQAGWEFIQDNFNIEEKRIRMDLQTALSTKCHSKYGSTY